MNASLDVRVRLFRMEEARRQTQRQLDIIDRQIARRISTLMPVFQQRRSEYRRGRACDPAPFLERYRTNLATISAERQPEIGALSRKLARQDSAIAALRERHCLDWSRAA